MAGKYKLFAKRFFIFLNIITVLLFLATCLVPYANPVKWWFISLLGLGFGFLLLLLCLFVFFWAVFKPRLMFLSLIPMLLGWKSISVFFAVHNPDKFTQAKPQATLRVVSWNVARFLELRRNNNKGSQTRLKMLDLIRQQNADVLCFQEFFHSTDSNLYDNISVLKDMGYPYFYYSWDGDGHLQWFGQAIFSRHPIIDSGIVHYPRPGMPESLIHADILFRNDTVRLYTTHLQSVQLKPKDYQDIEEIKNREDSIIENSRNLFSKLKRAIIYRSRQSEIVREITSISPHPYMVAGDFNDIPNSYTYFTIRQSMQDAFLKKGFGIGRTFSALAPTLRIDYILASSHFEVRQFNRLVKNFSDHYMLVTDVVLKK